MLTPHLNPSSSAVREAAKTSWILLQASWAILKILCMLGGLLLFFLSPVALCLGIWTVPHLSHTVFVIAVVYLLLRDKK